MCHHTTTIPSPPNLPSALHLHLNLRLLFYSLLLSHLISYIIYTVVRPNGEYEGPLFYSLCVTSINPAKAPLSKLANLFVRLGESPASLKRLNIITHTISCKQNSKQNIYIYNFFFINFEINSIHIYTQFCPTESPWLGVLNWPPVLQVKHDSVLTNCIKFTPMLSMQSVHQSDQIIYTQMSRYEQKVPIDCYPTTHIAHFLLL